MTTRVRILFIHDFDRTQFTRELDWSGPVPSVGSVITLKLDTAEVMEFTGAQWTITNADFVTRLNTSQADAAAADVMQVNLIARSGAKTTW